MLRHILLCSLIVASGPAMAQSDAPSDASQVRRLSPEEKERILWNSSEAVADASLASALGGGSSAGQVHGEVGVMAGTGGAFGIFGVAEVPLGDRGSAIISFSKEQYGNTKAARH